MSEPPTSSSVCRCQSIGLNVDGEAGWGARGVKSKGGQKKKSKGIEGLGPVTDRLSLISISLPLDSS